MSKAKGVSKGDRAMIDHNRLKAMSTEMIRQGELLLDIRETLAVISTLVIATEEHKEAVRKKMEEADVRQDENSGEQD